MLRVDFPLPFTNKNTPNNKREIEIWERSNCMCIIIMTKVIPEAFRGLMFEKVTIAKKFLAKIEQIFIKHKKDEISTLLRNLISIRYKGKYKGKKRNKYKKAIDTTP